VVENKVVPRAWAAVASIFFGLLSPMLILGPLFGSVAIGLGCFALSSDKQIRLGIILSSIGIVLGVCGTVYSIVILVQLSSQLK
jgi:hypothetical protein